MRTGAVDSGLSARIDRYFGVSARNSSRRPNVDLFGMYGAKQDAPDVPVPAEHVEHLEHDEPSLSLAESRAPRSSAVDRELERYVSELGAVVDDSRHLTRPYARTGGRTRTTLYLGLETLVMTRELNFSPADATDRFVCELCQEPRSVAEISAYAGLPFGVVKVIVDDLVDLGLIAVGHTQATFDGPSLQLMEKVLAGLRNL